MTINPAFFSKIIMKLFVFIVAITAASCYSVEKVKEINGAVGSLVSDAADNTFVIAYNESDKCTFYKLDSSNGVILSKELAYPAYVLVNQFGDAYIFSYQNGVVVTLWFLEASKTSVERLSDYVFNSESGCLDDAKSFVDNDNIIYINHRRGVSYLRPKENIIFGVKGLQGSKFCSHAVDDNGDVYLKLNNKAAVVIITKGEKNSKIVHYKTVPDSNVDYIINGYKNHVFGVNYGAKYVSTIQILQDRKIWQEQELLFLAYDVELKNPYSPKDHFVFFSYNRWGPTTLVYILAAGGGIQKIKSDFFSTPYIGDLSAANSDGHIFYSWHSDPKFESPVKFGILTIKPLEQKAEMIIVPSNSTINSILVDVDDNLWILADGLYLLPKGANTVIQISDLPVENSGKFKYFMNQKKLDKEILIGLQDGLYICKN